MTDEKVCIASADGHAGPPTQMYRDYLEKALHPVFDEYFATHVWRWSPTSKDSFFPPEKDAKFWNTEGWTPGVGTAIAWDAELRLKAMDQSMVACEVLFPDDLNHNDPPFGSGLANASVEGPQGASAYPPDLVRAGARAHNRWLAEFCSADPARLRGLTVLGTLDDVIWCVDEIHRAYESGLRTGIMLPLEYEQPSVHHPRYNVLWDVCTELNLPVVTHMGRGVSPYLGEDPLVQYFMFGADMMWAVQRPIWSFIMGGVCERFPNLRLVTTEAYVNWVPGLLQRFDGSFDGMPIQASRDVPGRVDFSMKPSEYWQRQCFVTHSISQRREEFEGEAYHKVPNMIFGADTAHGEGMWPVFGFPEPTPKPLPESWQGPVIPVQEAYRTIWGGLPASKMLQYLQDNFFRAYPNIDRAALNEVVDRIGPTTAELELV